jgi:putative ABC transport system ATP-binding protein
MDLPAHTDWAEPLAAARNATLNSAARRVRTAATGPDDFVPDLPTELISNLDMSIAQPVLRAEKISKQVSSPEGTLTILAAVDLQVAAGETVAIIGASGAGKSTLLALLAGLDEPSDGRIWLNGAELTALDEDGRAAVRAQHVGFVFQSFHLVPSLTAIENVMLPLELAGRSGARAAAAEVLEKVGLTPRREHYPRQLSGGEQQRVAIARAFVTRPALLFADEPTGNLDSVTGERIIELLFDLNRATQTTLVVVTHDQAIASRCGRTIRMEAGKVAA